jgi:hypothetical protein
MKKKDLDDYIMVMLEVLRGKYIKPGMENDLKRKKKEQQFRKEWEAIGNEMAENHDLFLSMHAALISCQMDSVRKAKLEEIAKDPEKLHEHEVMATLVNRYITHKAPSFVYQKGCTNWK